MKGIKKVFAIVLVAMMTVTFCACAAAASEAYDKETVKEVQQALNEAGFDCGTPDGIAGNNTKKAISDYQKSNGLTVTGEIDEALLEALFPAEEPEEAEVTADTPAEAEAEVKTDTAEQNTTVDEKTEAEAEKPEVASGEPQYEMTEDDAMYFTFDDGVLYRLTYNGKFVVYEKMTDTDTVEKKIRSHIHIDMVNYIVEKYFYAAIAKEEGLSTREIEKANMEDFSDEINTGIFKWDTNECQFTFLRNDTTWIMFYEDNLIKVGKMEDEEVTEVLSFELEEAKEETEAFVNLSFVNSRLIDDQEFEYEYYATL